MNNKAQNIIEYVLIVVAVISVLVFFLRPNGKMQETIENTTMNSVTRQIDLVSEEIQFGGQQGSLASGASTGAGAGDNFVSMTGGTGSPPPDANNPAAPLGTNPSPDPGGAP